MAELQTYLKIKTKSCETLKEFALRSHARCYIESNPGFCVVILDKDNTDGFKKVFEAKGLFGEDADYALQQVPKSQNQLFENLACTLAKVFFIIILYNYNIVI